MACLSCPSFTFSHASESSSRHPPTIWSHQSPVLACPTSKVFSSGTPAGGPLYLPSRGALVFYVLLSSGTGTCHRSCLSVQALGLALHILPLLSTFVGVRQTLSIHVMFCNVLSLQSLRFPIWKRAAMSDLWCHVKHKLEILQAACTASLVGTR